MSKVKKIVETEDLDTKVFGGVEWYLERIAIALESLVAQGQSEEVVPIDGTLTLGDSLVDVVKASNASSKNETLKTMKVLRKKGLTYNEIATALNEKGVPTHSGGGKWHSQTIHRLLTPKKTKKDA